MTSLRVDLVQTASGLNPAENRARLADLVPSGADLVVLPEAFQRDFGPPDGDLTGLSEPVDGPFAAELDRVATARGTTVVAGMFETGEDPARPFNTLLVRGAARAEYRKIHLYDAFGYAESDRFTAGPLTPVTVPFGEVTLGLMTCYDLRFPEQGRRLVDAGADVLVVPAAWVAGDRKVAHWQTLVRARAIENTAWVVAVGQPAPRYCGHSTVVSPEGDVLVEAGAEEEVVSAVIEVSVRERARRANPSLANRRL